MQALMLAAGMGRRLGKYTDAMTKCMVSVGGRSLLERAVESLKMAGIRKLIMVIGWEADALIEYIHTNITDMEFEFVYNHDYATTNNIYSLYLASEYLLKDDTILLESDLVFAPHLLSDIVCASERDLVAVAPYEQWMDGTVTILTPDGYISEFVSKKDFTFRDANKYFKTVNIYKFSKEFSEKRYLPFLKAYIKAYGANQYYESVLKVIAHISNTQLKAYILSSVPWYEIDDAQDLDIANTLFADNGDKLNAYERHYGGYWRFPGLKDFCYLVNPYYPPQKMLDQMSYSYDSLLTQYPSGMSVQKLIAGKSFRIDPAYLLVGNGAAELINVLGHVVKGRVIISVPAFNEYIRCFSGCKVITVNASECDYQTDYECILEKACEGDTAVLINPDNPSGYFIEKEEIETILERCKKKNVRCIIDESFADFACHDKRFTLLSDEVLEKYPNLVVVKSISKSYGVPGLRLGIIASSNSTLLQAMKDEMAIWNINSFAEYFLQIFSLYESSYKAACDRIAENREWMIKELEKIEILTTYPSQANYIMCSLSAPWKSKILATQLLQKYNILIKDLSEKTGVNGKQLIRIAVKNQEDNISLISAIKELSSC